MCEGLGAMKLKPNPRRPISNWRMLYDKIQKIREKGISLEAACVQVGIAYSTYHQWKKRVNNV